MLIFDYVTSHCRGGDDCDLVQVPFAAETGSQTVQFSNTPSNPTNDCARAVVEFSLDGQRLQSRYVGPNWEQPSFTINAAPGKTRPRRANPEPERLQDRRCGVLHRTPEDMGGRPTRSACPLSRRLLPSKGRWSPPNPDLPASLFMSRTAAVSRPSARIRRGVHRQLRLAGQRLLRLFVPAVRLFKTRTGTITCDNGTSTNLRLLLRISAAKARYHRYAHTYEDPDSRCHRHRKALCHSGSARNSSAT